MLHATIGTSVIFLIWSDWLVYQVWSLNLMWEMIYCRLCGLWNRVRLICYWMCQYQSQEVVENQRNCCPNFHLHTSCH